MDTKHNLEDVWDDEDDVEIQRPAKRFLFKGVLFLLLFLRVAPDLGSRAYETPPHVELVEVRFSSLPLSYCIRFSLPQWCLLRGMKGRSVFRWGT